MGTVPGVCFAKNWADDGENIAQCETPLPIFKFIFHISMAGIGMYYGTPYTIAAGACFLIMSANDLAEAKGFR